ncbi:MAG: D-amino acid dehydrogenase, partial [Gammaproteobacteria bacterium]|nr:D-amino acid dehydrogenase [Gammaproteobacteria bacterium]
MKILILGSGVIGVTTAYFLARDGHEVTVIDRQAEPAQETSFANASLIAPGHAYAWASPKAPGILLRSLFLPDQALRLKLRADPHMWAWCWLFLRQCTAERARINTIRKLRLCMYSVECLNEVVADTGVRFDHLGKGNLYLYRSQESFDKGVAHMGILEEHGLELEVLDRSRVSTVEPVLEPVKSKIAGAVYSPRDQSGDARLFSQRLATYCEKKLDVSFQFGTLIRRIETASDRITRVVTDKGALSADRYVLALGCDSALLGRSIGLKLPIYPVKGYSVTLPVRGRNAVPAIGGVDEDNLVAYCPLGKRFRLTSTAEFSGYDRSHRPEDFRAMFRAARELFPAAADYDKPEYWAGLRPMTPEGTPFLGYARFQNLLLNTGHGHIGWTMSCGSARVTADIVAGRDPGIDLEGLR